MQLDPEEAARAEAAEDEPDELEDEEYKEDA